MANLPPIPEMIMTAIEMMNEPTGSNKSTIQNHIQSNYSSLPVDFSDLLLAHLEELKTAGQLILVNDCYKKPDSDSDGAAPVRRGRGRPPKAKPAVPAPPALPSGYGAPAARPRGRPPKTVDPLASPPLVKAAPPPTSGSGRKRGRPAKAGKAASVPKAVVLGPNGERRGRGRPPKVKVVAAPIDMEA